MFGVWWMEQTLDDLRACHSQSPSGTIWPVILKAVKRSKWALLSPNSGQLPGQLICTPSHMQGKVPDNLLSGIFCTRFLRMTFPIVGDPTQSSSAGSREDPRKAGGTGASFFPHPPPRERPATLSNWNVRDLLELLHEITNWLEGSWEFQENRKRY